MTTRCGSIINTQKRPLFCGKYNSSGILVHKLNKKLDESLVLVFPLRKLNEKFGYSRRNIVMTIENYLIEQNVPIIDYYSYYIG